MHPALDGRVALVTGASSGIGRQVALTAVAAGARVFGVGRDEGRLAAVGRSAAGGPGRFHPVPADLTAPGAIPATVDRAGPVDVLVCCAAAPLRHAAIVEGADDLWQEQFLMNVTVPRQLLRAVQPGMAGRGGGSVVFVSSVASTAPQPLLAAYGASKAALESLARSAAMELGPDGIRCNCVAPGLVDTERTHHLIDGPAGAAQRRATPLGRLAEVGDVADVIVWLASDAARFVTGQILTVDGGRTAGRFEAGARAKS